MTRRRFATLDGPHAGRLQAALYNARKRRRGGGAVGGPQIVAAVDFRSLTQAQATARLTSGSWSMARAGSATARTASGGVDIFGANVPRIEHDGGGARLGYLSEPSAIAKGGGELISIGSPVVTPFDASAFGDASFVNETIAASVNWHRRQRSSYAVQAGVDYPVLFRLAEGSSGNVFLNLRDSAPSETHIRAPFGSLALTSTGAGTISDLKETLLPNGETAVSGIFMPNLTGSLQIGAGPYSSGAVGDVNVLGWNLIEGLPGSYIPAGEDDVARASDQLSYDVSDGVLDGGFCIIVEARLPIYRPSFARVIEVAESATRRASLRLSGSSSLVAEFRSGSGDSSFSAPGAFDGGSHKIGILCAGGGCAFALDGALVGSDSFDRRISPSSVGIGHSPTASGLQLNGLIESVLIRSDIPSQDEFLGMTA